MAFIVFQIIILFRNLDLLANKNKFKENEILFRIRSRNIKNIFTIIFCLLLFIQRVYELFTVENINFEHFFSILYVITTIMFIPLFLTSFKLLFMEGAIIGNILYSNEGVFNIEEIRSINRLNKNKLYVSLKKANKYAINGTKIFKVKEEEMIQIMEYINEKISKKPNSA